MAYLPPVPRQPMVGLAAPIGQTAIPAPVMPNVQPQLPVGPGFPNVQPNLPSAKVPLPPAPIVAPQVNPLVNLRNTMLQARNPLTNPTNRYGR